MKTKNRFYITLGIVCAALILILAIFFAVFYDIIKHYELSQPHSGAMQFAESITDEEIDALITSAAENSTLYYEDSETVLSALYSGADGEFSCAKDFTKYTSDAPVFVIYKGTIPLYRVTLGRGDDLRYGFSSWKVETYEAITTAHDAVSHKVNVFVPRGTTLLVNGVTITDDSVGTSPYKFASKWEANLGLAAERYVVHLILDTAQFTCLAGDVMCDIEYDGDDVYFRYPDSITETYTLEAPTGASVTVNGLTLTDADAVEVVPYAAYEFDKSHGSVPTYTVYKITGLTKTPTVSAQLGDDPLALTLEDCSFTAAYPESLYHTCTIRVPTGSSVTINGVPLTGDLISATESESEDLFSYTKVPTYDVYTLEKLFFAPSGVAVTYNGTALPISDTAEDTTYSYNAAYPAAYSPEAEEVAIDFVKDYFYYTTMGYSDIKANLAAVLKHIPYGSTLYDKMTKSMSGFSFTSPAISYNYNTLEVTSTTAYPGGFTLVSARFDVSQSYYGGIHREFKGDIFILVTADMEIVGMEIDAEK